MLQATEMIRCIHQVDDPCLLFGWRDKDAVKPFGRPEEDIFHFELTAACQGRMQGAAVKPREFACAGQHFTAVHEAETEPHPV